MKFRVTATHAIEGSVILSEPEGLVQMIAGFTRHPTFHSLVKDFKSPLRLYGSNGQQDGRRDWVKNIERVYGPDTVIEILVEVAQDGFVFATFFQGEVGIQTVVEYLDFSHELELTPVQKGFWRKAISRYDVPVNVFGNKNLDGESVLVPDVENLIMTPQVIRMNGSYKQVLRNDMGTDWTGFPASASENTDFANGQYVSFSLDTDVLNEVTTKYNLPVAALNALPNPYFVMEYAGTYTFHLYLNVTMKLLDTPAGLYCYRDVSNGTPSTRHELKLYIKFGNHQEIEMTGLALGQSVPPFTSTHTFLNTSTGLDEWSEFDYTFTGITLEASTPVFIYFKVTDRDFFEKYNIVSGFVLQPVILGTDNTNIPWSDLVSRLPFQATVNPSYITVVADTIYPENNVEAILMHDLGAAILDRITDPNKLYAPVIGGQYTHARTYAEEGPYWNNINYKLINSRGYSLSEKQFSASLKDFFEGGDPMFNWGMGYETIGLQELITIRNKADYYDSSSMSVLLSGVQKITRKYGPDYFNVMSTGYQDGRIESVNSIDTPQQQTRASIFKNIGTKIEKFSTWIGQGSTIEDARRTTRKKSADYTYDDKIGIIEVTKSGSDYVPRLDEDFTSVTGILNESSRYNKHHTPARFFLRWMNYFSGGLQSYLGTVFRFVSGVGNYDMVSTMIDGSVPDDYGGNPLSEKADITVTNDYLWIPKIFEIQHFMTLTEFNTIDANRRLAIGISQSDTDYQAFFIDDLQYEVSSGSVKITGKFKEEFDIITVPPGSQIFQGGQIFDATFAFEFE